MITFFFPLSSIPVQLWVMTPENQCKDSDILPLGVSTGWSQIDWGPVTFQWFLLSTTFAFFLAEIWCQLPLRSQRQPVNQGLSKMVKCEHVCLCVCVCVCVCVRGRAQTGMDVCLCCACVCVCAYLRTVCVSFINQWLWNYLSEWMIE